MNKNYEIFKIERYKDLDTLLEVSGILTVTDADIGEAEGILRKTGAGAYVGMKTNLAAAVAPTVNEDSGDGYVVGSIWINTTDDQVYEAKMKFEEMLEEQDNGDYRILFGRHEDRLLSTVCKIDYDYVDWMIG